MIVRLYFLLDHWTLFLQFLIILQLMLRRFLRFIRENSGFVPIYLSVERWHCYSVTLQSLVVISALFVGRTRLFFRYPLIPYNVFQISVQEGGCFPLVSCNIFGFKFRKRVVYSLLICFSCNIFCFKFREGGFHSLLRFHIFVLCFIAGIDAVFVSRPFQSVCSYTASTREYLSPLECDFQLQFM